jgi:hypothetical protein
LALSLRKALENPRLASIVSFLPILRFWPFLFLRLPQLLPTADGNRQSGRRQVAFWARSWSLLGLPFVDTIGAGPFTGLTIYRQ